MPHRVEIQPPGLKERGKEGWGADARATLGGLWSILGPILGPSSEVQLEALS